MKKANTPILETERLRLRKFTRADISDILKIYGDQMVNEFLPWFPLASLEEAERYLINNIFREYEKEIAYRYAIECKSTKRIIGYISLHDIRAEQGSADLGYGLLKEFWNQGVITEAAQVLLDTARKNGFRHVTATHDVNNPASGRVMEKIGMTFRYAYEEQWQPKDFKVTFRLYRIDFMEPETMGIETDRAPANGP